MVGLTKLFPRCRKLEIKNAEILICWRNASPRVSLELAYNLRKEKKKGISNTLA
jgi:hypothetical protein